MARFRPIPLMLVAGLSCLGACATREELPFVPLFNGVDLAGWKGGASNPFWKVVDGVITGTSDAKLSGNVLATERTFKDGVFETEFRFSGDIDSGVFFRKPEIQAQIGISRMYRRDLTCSLYAGGDYIGWAYGVGEALVPDGWNTMRVILRGPRFTVLLNGVEVLDYWNDAFGGAAPIKLQIHAGVRMKIEFRNLRFAEPAP